jgi:hypothetical protein
MRCQPCIIFDLETFEEREDALGWTKALRFDSWRSHGIERQLLHSEIYLHVHVRGGSAFMTEPQGNDCKVHASLEQMHRRRVSNGVRRDVTPRQGRTALRRCRDGQF